MRVCWCQAGAAESLHTYIRHNHQELAQDIGRGTRSPAIHHAPLMRGPSCRAATSRHTPRTLGNLQEMLNPGMRHIESDIGGANRFDQVDVVDGPCPPPLPYPPPPPLSLSPVPSELRTDLAANQIQTPNQLNRTYNPNLAAGSSPTIFLLLPSPPCPFWSATQTMATYNCGGLCGMPACGQAVGCGICDTPELWRGAAGLRAHVHARVLVPPNLCLHTYIHIYV